MGAGNVKAVFALWSDLAHAPFRVLLYMAVVAQDGEPSPRFWGGRESLALALGRQKLDNASIKAVDRALSALVRAGAIAMIGLPGPGKNAIYQLSLSIERTTVSGVGSDHGDRGPMNGERTTVSGHNGPRSAGERTTVSGRTDHGERGPEEEQELLGLKTGRSGPGGRVRATRAIAGARVGARIRAREPKLSSLEGGGADTDTDRQQALWPAPVHTQKASGQ